ICSPRTCRRVNHSNNRSKGGFRHDWRNLRGAALMPLRLSVLLSSVQHPATLEGRLLSVMSDCHTKSVTQENLLCEQDDHPASTAAVQREVNRRKDKWKVAGERRGSQILPVIHPASAVFSRLIQKSTAQE